MKIIKKYYSIVFVLFINLWIWKVLGENVYIFALLLFSTLGLWIYIKNKKSPFLFLICFLPLIFFQYQKTDKASLTSLSNDEQRLQQVRLRAHPPLKISIAGKDVWIPTGNWFELRKEAVAFYKIKNNFSQIIDPNLYFFANHPRERVGYQEFEKFPYILLPLFLIGLFSLKKDIIKKFWPFLIAVFLISIIGNKNPLGPFSLFPFFVVTTAQGFEKFQKEIKKLPSTKKRLVIYSSLIFFILIFVQTIAYAKF